MSLVNVFHVLEIRKNLVSANLLSKKGFKIVLKSDKVIVTKSKIIKWIQYCLTILGS